MVLPEASASPGTEGTPALPLTGAVWLKDLSPEQIHTIMNHPAQRAVLSRIEALIGQLRDCSSAEDLYEFQRQLFGELDEVQTRRAACSPVTKCLRQNSRLPADRPPLLSDLDPHDINSWRLEELVCVRLDRQYRAVGDALAWKTFGYDRRPIIALSRNAPAGPAAGKAGQQAELAVVQTAWEERGHFVLIHDLTSCLRVADLTEIVGENALIHEVKTSQGRLTWLTIG